MKTLDAVLNRIDQDIDQSVERLFALLRIASVSTDPAFKDQCRAAAEHAAWLCSSVFDGARTFEGVSPDLDLHCERVNASAETMHLKAVVPAETWLGLTRDGIKRFDKDAALYIRPMYWAERSGALLVAPDPETTKWCLSVYEAPMRKPEGFSVTLSPYRKPSLECMSVIGRVMPIKKTAVTAASTVFPISRASAKIQAPANPPSTAKGGTTNTKWRSPL